MRYQTGDCAVVDLAVGEDRCAIWPCEDETLCEGVHEKTSCVGSTAVRICRLLVLQCGSRRSKQWTGEKFPSVGRR